MRNRPHTKTLAVAGATALALSLTAGASASAKGFIEDELQYEYYYGTFGQTPNIALFAGGEAQEFCGEGEPGHVPPGTAPMRVFPRKDGSVDLKVNAKDQPINLYYIDAPGSPEWLAEICPGIEAGDAPPVPFASGKAALKVRDTIVSEDRVEFFNSVKGKAQGTDGTRYRVRASADGVVEDGVLVGDPSDVVTFTLKEIRR